MSLEAEGGGGMTLLALLGTIASPSAKTIEATLMANAKGTRRDHGFATRSVFCIFSTYSALISR